jgi:4-hydroxy-3-polyprenylbenzoate decarboxylase
MTSGARKRLIVAITGASGAIYGVRALEILRARDVETHFVISPAGVQTLLEETPHSLKAVKERACAVHSHRDVGAALASGSFVTEGMLIAPCSIKTLSGIVHSYADNLIVRAADVCLKERRRVVALVRETPLHLGHIGLMKQACKLGLIVMPPVPAFYFRPQRIEEIVDHTVQRALELFGFPSLHKGWKETPAAEIAVLPEPLKIKKPRNH